MNFKKTLAAFLSASILVCPATQAQSVILTSDQQLHDITDPDRIVDLSVGNEPFRKSFRQVCEWGKSMGSTQLIVAFDEFFRQYRMQVGTERRLTPDMDEYIGEMKKVSDFAKGYGLGLCLSLLSPLELGPAFVNKTGEGGRWLAYKVGLRNANNGHFGVDIWQHLYWTNNKGRVKVRLTGVKAYAFKQQYIGGSGYIAVNPDNIVELENVKYTVGDTVDLSVHLAGGVPAQDMGFPACRTHVYYDGPEQPDGYDHVLVVLEYATPEMDYFSPKAPGFLTGLVEKYKAAGINLTALYSDEMHIQQDWAYFSHHEDGQFAQRYLTRNMQQVYREKYGMPIDDKYMLYFAYGAPYYEGTTRSVDNVQYVFGTSPADIQRTFLFRDRYYKLLNNHVVDLFKNAREHAEKVFGRELPTGAHASWAQSPTIDDVRTERINQYSYLYDYTSNFVASNTVHQAAAACYDYFKWGEYLIHTGNDFAEGGWADRDYYGAAMAASIGVINKDPSAYAAVWGIPDRARIWKEALNEAYGCRPSKPMQMMTGGVHRDIEVLIAYPMNLVAADQRFGSWMTQYGYANYLTSEKICELATVTADGRLKVKDKEYNTLVVMFEPLPSEKFLALLERFAREGGRVVWFSMPAMISQENNDCSAQWQQLFGLEYEYSPYRGYIAAGKQVTFEGSMAGIQPQTILTDFTVDRIYPVKPAGGSSEVVARCGNDILGIKHTLGKGTAWYFGFRPRDDQSASLGYETRTLFEILNRAGSYPPSGKFKLNDNPTVVSRTKPYFASTFPNGTTCVVKHYRHHVESWTGGFSRNQKADSVALEANPLPSDSLELVDFQVNGNRINYSGRMNMAYRLDKDGRLTAFLGKGCKDITIDGTRYDLASAAADVFFAPTAGDPMVYEAQITGNAEVSLPLPSKAKKAEVLCGGNAVPSKVSKGVLTFIVSPELSGQWLRINLK